jgi:hypothetical protein
MRLGNTFGEKVIRQLKVTDYSRMLEIANLRLRIGGTGVIGNLDYAIGNYLVDEYKISLGYFENDILISYICIGLHENVSRGKFWYISFLFNSKIGNYYTFNKPENGLLLVEAFSHAERHGYYEYYYMISKRIEHVYDRQWAKNGYLPTGRYETITLDTIPANTVSDVDLYWQLMGCEIKSDVMIVKKRILNDKYRL